MAEEQAKALIRQYYTLVRYRHKLPDSNFTEELLSVWSNCLKYQETGTAQLREKTKECEKIKERLDIVHDVMVKLYKQFEDHIKHCQIDFANSLKTRSESPENANVVLKSEHDILKSELEALKLNNMALNSSLNLAHESLNEEKLQREQIENDRKNLEYLLLKYQQRRCQLEEMNNTTTQVSCDNSNSSIIESESDIVLRMDTSTSENNLNENNCSDTFTYNDQSTIPPPFSFGDDDISVENVDPREFILNKPDYAETNTFDETSNLSVRRKLQERVPRQNSNFSANNLESSLSTQVNDLPMQNSSVNDSELIAVKNSDGVDVVENSFIDSSMRKLPEPLKTNDNLALSTTLSGCKQILTTRAVELSNSKISITPEKSHFECDTCGRIFSKKISIIAHMRIHMKTIQSFQSENCGKPFPTENGTITLGKYSTCNENDSSHGNRNEKTIIIDALENERSGKNTQIGDYSEKSQDIVSDIRCIICNKHYSSKSSLNAHIRVIHNGEKPYKCTECGKCFAEKGNLKRHIFVHRSQKPFKCSVCKVGFKDPRDERRHRQVVHEGAGHLQCAHCDKLFSNRHQLISHIHTKHFSGFQKQFKCTICDKSFALKYQLQRHMLSHSSKRSFKCSVCNRTFKFPQYKIRHEKTVHKVGTLFRCKQCGKLYKHKAFLIRHMQKNHVE